MLFDTNGFFGISENILNSKSVDIFDAKKGLMYGNMFPDLYDSYKNYEVKSPVFRTEREKKLALIQECDFAINDLNLYLDLNKDDKEKYELFKRYVEKSKILKDEYTKIYGPLCLEDITDDYEWSAGVWPWEGRSL